MNAEPQDGTVGKALSVLDAVAEKGGPVRFAELLADSNLPKATLYRLLQTLVSQRMLTLDADTGTYALGPRLMRFAHAAWSIASLGPIARPHLDALSAEVDQTIHLAQLDHGQVLYLDKRNAARPISMFSDAGKIGPAYCTGVGKAMLAHLGAEALDEALAQQSWFAHTSKTRTTAEALKADLATIRVNGFAFDDEEHEPGIICIAVPILTEAGQPLGAMSITSSTLRHTLQELQGYAPNLIATGRAIAAEAATWRFRTPNKPH